MGHAQVGRSLDVAAGNCAIPIGLLVLQAAIPVCDRDAGHPVASTVPGVPPHRCRQELDAR